MEGVGKGRKRKIGGAVSGEGTGTDRKGICRAEEEEEGRRDAEGVDWNVIEMEEQGGLSKKRLSSSARVGLRFECAKCEKKFKYKYCVRNHMRVHTGEIPFMCMFPGCEMRFKWRSSLNSHIVAHQQRSRAVGPKQDFDCPKVKLQDCPYDGCQQLFNNRTDYIRHMYREHMGTTETKMETVEQKRYETSRPVPTEKYEQRTGSSKSNGSRKKDLGKKPKKGGIAKDEKPAKRSNSGRSRKYGQPAPNAEIEREASVNLLLFASSAATNGGKMAESPMSTVMEPELVTKTESAPRKQKHENMLMMRTKNQDAADLNTLQNSSSMRGLDWDFKGEPMPLMGQHSGVSSSPSAKQVGNTPATSISRLVNSIMNPEDLTVEPLWQPESFSTHQGSFSSRLRSPLPSRGLGLPSMARSWSPSPVSAAIDPLPRLDPVSLTRSLSEQPHPPASSHRMSSGSQPKLHILDTDHRSRRPQTMDSMQKDQIPLLTKVSNPNTTNSLF